MEVGLASFQLAVITELLHCLIIQAAYPESIVAHLKRIFRSMMGHNNIINNIFWRVLYTEFPSSSAYISLFYDLIFINIYLGT